MCFFNKRLAVFVVLEFLLLSGYSQAQRPTSKNAKKAAAEMSLEEMLNTTITVAGKKAEKISDSPAIITVITADEIEKMGALSLYEVLSYVPGINVTETSYGYTSVSFRGSLQTHYNNKSLLLINNHPIYENVVGSYYLEQIPLSAVDRIEVMRGPASTLYGTNAFAGIIKVVTKRGSQLAGGSVELLGGSFDTGTLRLSYGDKVGNSEFGIAFDGVNSGGYDYNITKDEDGRAATLKYRDNVYAGLFSYNYKGLDVNAGYFRNKKDKFGLVPSIVSSGPRSLEGTLVDANYQFQMTPKLSSAVLFYYDNISKNEMIGWYPPSESLRQKGVGEPEEQQYFGSKVGTDVRLAYAVNDNSQLTTGFYYERQDTDPYPFMSIPNKAISTLGSSAYLNAYDSHDTSGYAQYDTRFFKKLGVVGGLRYNKNKDYGSKVTPRAGVVYSPSGKLSLKALYAKAYRNPNFFEKYVASTNVLFGDSSLKPEELSSIDAAIDYRVTTKNNVRINYFYVSTDNLITRGKIIPAGQLGNTKNTPQYANSMGQRITGVEFELKGALREKTMYFLNYSYMRGEEKANNADIMFIPHSLFNVGANLNFAQHFTLSPYLQFVGEKKGQLVSGTPAAVDSYLLFNLNLDFRVTDKWQISLICKNLNNSDYTYPEYVRRIIPDIPGGPGRSVYVRLAYRFQI